MVWVDTLNYKTFLKFVKRGELKFVPDDYHILNNHRCPNHSCRTEIVFLHGRFEDKREVHVFQHGDKLAEKFVFYDDEYRDEIRRGYKTCFNCKDEIHYRIVNNPQSSHDLPFKIETRVLPNKNSLKIDFEKDPIINYQNIKCIFCDLELKKSQIKEIKNKKATDDNKIKLTKYSCEICKQEYIRTDLI